MFVTQTVTTRGGQYLCLFSLLICFFSYFSLGIWDSDFWWHLASGNWILEHSALPQLDPFQVFSNSDAVRNDTVLKGQWLGQVVFAAVYGGFDTWGIVVLRATMLMLCLYLLFVRARMQQASLFATWIMVVLAGLISLGFTSDRPQLFSYIFAVVCFLLLELYERDKKMRWLLMLPLVALIWANTHGGFLLMAALLAVYVILAMMQSIAQYKKLDAMAVMLVVILGLFMLASLLTPNGFTTYQYLFDLEGSLLQGVTSEYRSSFKLYELGYALPQVWVIAIYAAALISLFGLFKAPPQRMIIMVVLGVISAISYRYLAFFVFLAGPYIAEGLTLAFRDYSFTQSNAARAVNKYTGLLVLCVSLAFVVYGFKNDSLYSETIKSDMFPIAAVDLIKQHNIKGKMFNHMQWGGYLLWRTYPDISTYIDGRMLEQSKFPPYTNILWATPVGIEVFNKEKFDLVLLPKTNRFTGEEYSLNHHLLRRPDWKVLYEDAHSYLFQKAG